MGLNVNSFVLAKILYVLAIAYALYDFNMGKAQVVLLIVIFAAIASWNAELTLYMIVSIFGLFSAETSQFALELSIVGFQYILSWIIFVVFFILVVTAKIKKNNGGHVITVIHRCY